jgi:hypothetical protein
MTSQLSVDAFLQQCILMFAKPTGERKAHYWINRITRSLPVAEHYT